MDTRTKPQLQQEMSRGRDG